MIRQRAADGHGNVSLSFYALATTGTDRRSAIVRYLRERSKDDAAAGSGAGVEELARKLADVAPPACALLYRV